MNSKSIHEWQLDVYELARSKGWHERPLKVGEVINVDGVAAKLALVHSEISEALEALRADPTDLGSVIDNGNGGKPEGFEVELADAVIRILDMAEALGLDIESAMQWKHSYNASRPHRHGGKAL